MVSESTEVMVGDQSLTKPVDRPNGSPSAAQSSQGDASEAGSAQASSCPTEVAVSPAAADSSAGTSSTAASDSAGGQNPNPAPKEGAPAPAEGAAAAAQETPSGEASATPGKKRRRRRRGKKPAGQEGQTEHAGAEGAAEGEEGAEEASDEEGATAEGAEGAKPGSGEKKDKPGDGGRKKRGGHKGSAQQQQRERSAFHVGEEVFGKVTSVTDNAIMVDLSGKALAIFDRNELAADDLLPEVGDRFVARIHGDGSRGGLVVLTRKPLREEEVKPRVEEAAKSGATIRGLVTGTVKGGIEVDIDGLRAFAPGSHVDLRPGADLAYLIGRRLDFTVAQYAKRGRDVVVSRKNFVEAEAKEQRKTSLAKLETGAVVKGVVRSVVPYGAFVAIPSADEVEGLVHMTEASHDRNARLNDIFRVGAEIDVKVLRVDEKGKLWLSHKATVADPWEEAMKTFAVGTRHKGRVARIQPFGVFVELAPGIDGLVHTSDLSFKRIEHPSEVAKEGDEIEIVVAEIDRSGRKLTLHPAPPAEEENEPRQRVAPHKAVKVSVVSVESSGLIVRVLGLTGRHARGFIPAGHTGTERGTDLRKHFPLGMRLDAKVLEVDPRRGEAKLSLRAFKEDTEKAAYNEYRASVAKASKFGTLGDLLAKKL